mgnify:FL=1
MKILFASPEVAPFIKTGGLADVAGSLPPALAELGHDVRVILPLYEQIGEDWRSQMTFVKYYYVRLAWRSIYCGLFQLERNGVTYYFVDNESYFKRQGIYGHFDDAERFAYFSRAVIETPGQIDFKPDIIHCNDWQTALVPIYLLEERYRQNTLSRTKSVFTIHNIEYQGRYGRDLLEDLFGLDESYFNENMLKFYDDISLVKGAVNAADYVTTVSPNYANELQFSFYAHGLEGVIAANRGKLRGILNGIDMKANDPSTRKDLAARFTSRNHKGKAKCKAALQERLGLKVDPNVPIIACISRLVGHKGFELVCQAFRGIMDMEVQFVLLGTGEWGYEQFFRNAQNEYPGRVSANILYDGALSDAIYAGADLFLMPSIAEPCGLSQMFAMRYGTVPVVRMTGGLLDSVPAYNPEENTGLGFTFGSVDAGDMLGALYRAVGVYYDDKKAWDQLVTRDMEADFSWDRSAQEYVDVYRTITGLE